jgi:hypothetical protein
MQLSHLPDSGYIPNVFISSLTPQCMQPGARLSERFGAAAIHRNPSFPLSRKLISNTLLYLLKTQI